MEDQIKLFLSNRAWAAEKLSDDPTYFENLAKDQRPDYLWIGCSDSRVPAPAAPALPASPLTVSGRQLAPAAPVAPGVTSVIVSGLAYGRCTRAPLWPISPSTDTRVVSVVFRVKVLRSPHTAAIKHA
jgi:hypothetical protein